MKMLSWDYWAFSWVFSWGNIWVDKTWEWGFQGSEAYSWHFCIGRIVISRW